METEFTIRMDTEARATLAIRLKAMGMEKSILQAEMACLGKSTPAEVMALMGECYLNGMNNVVERQNRIFPQMVHGHCPVCNSDYEYMERGK